MRWTRRLRKGFTLIELMLVVAIIGLLAAIAFPRFANLVVKAQEARIKGTLGSVRGALRIYYVDNEERASFPGTIDTLTVGKKYLNELPYIQLPSNVPGLHKAEPWGFRPEDIVSDGVFTGSGVPYAWANSITLPANMDRNATIHVNCTHTDSQGRIWSTW